MQQQSKLTASQPSAINTMARAKNETDLKDMPTDIEFTNILNKE